MDLGLYVHAQGPSLLKEASRPLNEHLRSAGADLVLSEIDGLFLGINSTSAFYSGLKPARRKVRRDYALKLITGGSVHYRCMVELNALVADGEAIAASSSEFTLFDYLKLCLQQMLPIALRGFPNEDLTAMQSIVAAAAINRTPHW